MVNNLKKFFFGSLFESVEVMEAYYRAKRPVMIGICVINISAKLGNVARIADIAYDPFGFGGRERFPNLVEKYPILPDGEDKYLKVAWLMIG